MQTSASLSVTPSDWGTLVAGDEIDLAIAAHNASADTPAGSFPDGNAPVAARLAGPISVHLACAGGACSAGSCPGATPGNLAFVPVGPTGCVARSAAVTSCAASGPGTIAIALGSAGLALPAGGSAQVATVRVRVVETSGVARLGVCAASAPGAVVACSTGAPSMCAPCRAEGCTMLAFAQGVVTGCPHPCPSKIRFLTAGKPDAFEFHALIDLPAAFDPSGQPFHLSLANPAGAIFDFSLPAGALKRQGTTYLFNDATAKTQGGLAMVKLTRRAGSIGVYRIDVQAHAALTAATGPHMTVAFAVGPHGFSTTDLWAPKAFGWQLDLP